MSSSSPTTPRPIATSSVTSWASSSVDSGGGWLIFAMPPSEIAFHPTDESPTNEIYLLCDDLTADMSLDSQGVVYFTQVDEERWGTIDPVHVAGRNDDRALSAQAPDGASARLRQQFLGALVVTRRLSSAPRSRPANAKKRDHEFRTVTERGDGIGDVEARQDRDQPGDAQHGADLTRHVEYAAAGAETSRGNRRGAGTDQRRNGEPDARSARGAGRARGGWRRPRGLGSG